MNNRKSEKIEKVVRKPKDLTQSGIPPTNSTARTLQLNDTARRRSARIGRVLETVGIKGVREMSEFTKIQLGAMGRIARAGSCASMSDCFKVSAAAFSPPSDRDKYIVYPSYPLGNKNAPQPQKINDDGVDIAELLKDLFSVYGDSNAKDLIGFIDRNNTGEERDNKKFLSIALQIFLFQMLDVRARIAYPSDPHSGLSQNIIAGYMEVSSANEITSLNGKICIVIHQAGAAALLRRVHIVNNQLLCTSVASGVEGAFIIPLDNSENEDGERNLSIHSIGEAQMIIVNEHTDLMKSMLRQDDGAVDDEDEILVIK